MVSWIRFQNMDLIDQCCNGSRPTDSDVFDFTIRKNVPLVCLIALPIGYCIFGVFFDETIPIEFDFRMIPDGRDGQHAAHLQVFVWINEWRSVITCFLTVNICSSFPFPDDSSHLMTNRGLDVMK